MEISVKHFALDDQVMSWKHSSNILLPEHVGTPGETFSLGEKNEWNELHAGDRKTQTGFALVLAS